MRVFREKCELAPDVWQIEGSEQSVEGVIVMDTKTDGVIGQPSLYGAVVSFYASFCLRCISEDHLYSQISHHLAKLSKIAFFGRAEDSMLIRVKRHGDPVFC